MKWPFDSRAPDNEAPLLNRFYLNASRSTEVDNTVVWGTEIDADSLKSFLVDKNRNSDVIVTTAHVLIRAMGLALARFPEVNVRIVGHKLYPLKDRNVRIAFLHKRYDEIDLMMISQADTKSLEGISREIWNRLLEAGRNEGGRDRDLRRLRRVPQFWLRQLLRLYNFLDRNLRLPSVGRLDATRSSCATVNDLSFIGAPPMRAFKPTRFPDNSDLLNLSLGPVEAKVVLLNGVASKINVMPLFLRADHRVIDVYRAARLLAFIQDVLNRPRCLEEEGDQAIATEN